MSLHNFLPLVAFFLNVSLAGVALFRNPRSRLNRVFAYFVSALALWNFGVFMLRRAPDEWTAYFWEVIIHVGVISLPAFYYHFVLIFLDSTTRHRPSLTLAYTLAFLFTVTNVAEFPAFLKGVTPTYWGWAPATGALYYPFLLYFNAFLIYGLVHLVKANRGVESSFRRNRATLIVFGSFMSLLGGLVDIFRFILARFIPAAEHVYPMGIPANMIFALMLATSIVRYRLFDVNVAVKKTAIYLVACAGITGFLALATRTIEERYGLEEVSALWIVVPMGLVITLFLTPMGRPLADFVDRITFSKRRGCYETLLALSKQMSTILDFRKLIDTLVQGLVRGIPVTHCALMIYDETTNAYVIRHAQTTTEERTGVSVIRADSAIAQWLKGTEGVFVKEEVKLNPKIAGYFEAAEGELDAIKASLIVPLKVETKLIGILLIGEKLSGDIFSEQELDVLSVLANQAAIALENARLYEELQTSHARLSQASQLKSQFLASMSHELRTPLNSIIGFSKVLLNRIDGDLTDRQEAYIRSVHNSSRHLLQLINSILDFSRIEAGKLEARLEEIDLYDLVEECIETSVPLVRGKPVKIEKELPLELPRIQADRMKIKQILLNLLSNAIKFTAAGRVVVRVQREPSTVHISVADTGIGIRADDLPKLFEPFQRLDSPLAREAGGTGLGLAISKKYVELHGGRIWAESRENYGSTFHFTLPLAQPVN